MSIEAANAAVHDLLDELQAEGCEEGVQVCCTLDGRVVIDTWAGVADRDAGRLVDGDSIFTIFSATKGVSATCLHLLAERGALDYNWPLVRFWPEFGASGKSGVTVRDVMTHRSGVVYLPEGATPEQLCDWDGMCAAFAAMAPAFEPGKVTRLPVP
jgi:CubicO group peptidase (beta-lactamase class C family)